MFLILFKKLKVQEVQTVNYSKCDIILSESYRNMMLIICPYIRTALTKVCHQEGFSGTP
jgi:hypothetical protein